MTTVRPGTAVSSLAKGKGAGQGIGIGGFLALISASERGSTPVPQVSKTFSCSVCHTAHGMGASSGSVTGDRLIDFDISVVGQNAGAPISYNRATNSCTLVCHNAAHNADGTVSVGGAVLP